MFSNSNHSPQLLSHFSQHGSKIFIFSKHSTQGQSGPTGPEDVQEQEEEVEEEAEAAAGAAGETDAAVGGARHAGQDSGGSRAEQSTHCLPYGHQGCHFPYFYWTLYCMRKIESLSRITYKLSNPHFLMIHYFPLNLNLKTSIDPNPF